MRSASEDSPPLNLKSISPSFQKLTIPTNLPVIEFLRPAGDWQRKSVCPLLVATTPWPQPEDMVAASI